MQGTKHGVCSLFSSQCSPVMLLGMFSLETHWDGILLCEKSSPIDFQHWSMLVLGWFNLADT